MRKRDGTFNYNPDVYCDKYDEQTGLCPGGDECAYVHRNAGDTEKRYHLRYYKTASCIHETDTKGQCSKNGSHCAFAHGVNDQRPPVYDIRELHGTDLVNERTLSLTSSLEKERILNEDPKWNDTQYVLINYKTEQCKRPPRLCRQGFACPQYHNARDKRRNPSLFKYRSTPCPNVKQGDDWLEPTVCENGDHCKYCHSRTEQQFHPEIYKSSKCNDMISTGYCPRGPFCAFAHLDQELKVQRAQSTSESSDYTLESYIASALPQSAGAKDAADEAVHQQVPHQVSELSAHEQMAELSLDDQLESFSLSDSARILQMFQQQSAASLQTGSYTIPIGAEREDFHNKCKKLSVSMSLEESLRTNVATVSSSSASSSSTASPSAAATMCSQQGLTKLSRQLNSASAGNVNIILSENTSSSQLQDTCFSIDPFGSSSYLDKDSQESLNLIANQLLASSVASLQHMQAANLLGNANLPVQIQNHSLYSAAATLASSMPKTDFSSLISQSKAAIDQSFLTNVSKGQSIYTPSSLFFDNSCQLQSPSQENQYAKYCEKLKQDFLKERENNVKLENNLIQYKQVFDKYQCDVQDWKTKYLQSETDRRQDVQKYDELKKNYEILELNNNNNNMNNLNHQNVNANSVLSNISNSNSNISNNYSSNSNLSNTSTNSINLKILFNSKTLLPNDNEMSKLTLDNLQSLQMMLKNDLSKVDKIFNEKSTSNR